MRRNWWLTLVIAWLTATTALAQPNVNARKLFLGATGSVCEFRTGVGDPEGVQTAPVCTQYFDISDGEQWHKATGTGNTGWATSGGAGTVTSVGMTVPTGLTVSGPPITSAGTLAVALQSGYMIPGGGTLGYFLTSQGAAAPIWTPQTTVTPAALTRIDDTNVTLTLGGTPGTSLLQATSLTLGWAGQLSLARGGTNANLTAIHGGVVYSTASALAITAAGTTGQVLTSQGAAAPIWGPSASTTPCGVTGDVQFNTASAFDCDTGLFTYEKADDRLRVNNIMSQAGSPLAIAGAVGGHGEHATFSGGLATDVSGIGGNLILTSGAAMGGASPRSGDVTLRAGNTNLDMGTLTITTGSWPVLIPSLGNLIVIEPAAPPSNGGGPGTNGGHTRIASMAGQVSTSYNTAGHGGNLALVGGPGGSVTASWGDTDTGGNGGPVNVTTGVGGAASGTGGVKNGGDGGAFNVTTSAGGAASGSGATGNGGDGGLIVFNTGAFGTGTTANGANGTIQFKIAGTEFGRFHTDGTLRLTNVPLSSAGTVPGISGCSAGTQTGGAVGGTFASGTTGACNVTLTLAVTATTGYACFAQNVTTPANPYVQSGGTTTTATFTGTTVSGDVIRYFCFAY